MSREGVNHWNLCRWHAKNNTLKTVHWCDIFCSSSCDHRVWCKWYRLFGPCEVSFFIISKLFALLQFFLFPSFFFQRVFFCLQAVARRRLEGERPHRCPAVPRRHKERPKCASFTVLKWATPVFISASLLGSSVNGLDCCQQQKACVSRLQPQECGSSSFSGPQASETLLTVFKQWSKNHTCSLLGYFSISRCL